MAELVKISQLPILPGPLDGTETFPLVKDGITVKATITDVANEVARWGAIGGNLPDQIDLWDKLLTATFDSTGLISGCALSVNVGNPATFDVAGGVAAFADWSIPAAPTVTLLSFAPKVAQVVTHIATSNATYVGIDVSGNLVQQTQPFTNSQRRVICSLGALIHSNRTTINTTNTIVLPVRQSLNQIADNMRAIGQLNLNGNIYAPASTNLQIQKSSGEIFSPGSNFHIDPDDPHSRNIPAQNPVTFRYRLENGAEYSDTTFIDPNNYDSGGVLTPVSNNSWTVQVVALFQSGLTRIQYGHVEYNQQSEAVAAALAQQATLESNIAQNGVLRAFIAIKQGATDLSDTTQAVFVSLSKFGAASSVSPLAIATTDELEEGTTNLYYTATRVREEIESALVEGSNISITVGGTGASKTFTISAVSSQSDYHATYIAHVIAGVI